MSFRRVALSTVLVAVFAVAVSVRLMHTPGSDAAQPTPVALTTIATGFNQIIGVDYSEPTNQVLVSVNYSSGLPNNFELVAQDGSRSQFSQIVGLSDEVYIASVRSDPCLQGFTVGEAFTGTGIPGQIARISPDGTTAQTPWVTLPGEAGLLRGGLFVDRYCTFGGDLIIVTTTGEFGESILQVSQPIWLPWEPS